MTRDFLTGKLQKAHWRPASPAVEASDDEVEAAQSVRGKSQRQPILPGLEKDVYYLLLKLDHDFIKSEAADVRKWLSLPSLTKKMATTQA